MSAIPADVDAARGPPMAVPLRHFVVGLGLLVLGVALGLGVAAGVAPGAAALAHVHLLLAGWVCVTIMGAMTQFVPVWSGTRLHSERLATVQLWLVAVGVVGVAAAFLAGRLGWVPLAGGAMALGFWTFAYNLGRTLGSLDALDVTERHFAVALACFVLVSALGLVLAVDFRVPLLAALPVGRSAVVGAHVALAVFGAVLATVVGALYQLATMFTQTDLDRVDDGIRRVEEVAYPTGVGLLALGRLLDAGPLARVGGVLVACSLLAVGVVLARRLLAARVDWTPMLRRYAVVALSLILWAALALPAWLADARSPDALFGAPGTSHLLALGVVGFVVLGTLYHVVPFIVWVHRYSDRLGYEPVPAIDDLYSARVATADLGCLGAGTALLAGADPFGLPPSTVAVGGALVLVGAVLASANLAWVVRVHSPYSLPGVLVGGGATAGEEDATPSDADARR